MLNNRRSHDNTSLTNQIEICSPKKKNNSKKLTWWLRSSVAQQLQVTSFVYECLNNLAPIYFREYFVSIHSVHNIGTRQSKTGDLFALRCNTTQYGLRSIHYLGVRIWNSLPIEIRESPSPSIFKEKLKDFFQPIRKALKTPEFVLSEAIYLRTKKSFEAPDKLKGVVRTSEKNLPFPTILALLMLIF